MANGKDKLVRDQPVEIEDNVRHRFVDPVQGRQTRVIYEIVSHRPERNGNNFYRLVSEKRYLCIDVSWKFVQ
jgi:hypothetical protein